MNSTAVILAFTDADGWRLGIGDPTPGGWLTVFAYGAAALLAGRASLEKWRARRLNEALFWLILAGILLALGINKQLDLQTWFTLAGKRTAQAQGWYEQRRIVQALFILFVACGALAGFFVLWRLVRGRARQLWLPLLGLAFLLCFVVVRAASFHHVDQFLRFSLLGVRMNWVLELGGIAIVSLGAWTNSGKVRAVRRGALRARTA